MKTGLPHTPFATRLSGSAKETQLRIKNIVRGPKKRPPVWIMALTAAVILLCGSLVSCQPETSEPIDEKALAVQLGRKAYDSFDEVVVDQEADVILSRAYGRRTLLLAQIGPTPHTAGLDNIVLGVWDSRKGDFVGHTYLCYGDFARWSSWETGDGDTYLLLANSTVYNGSEDFAGLSFFRFHNGVLSVFTELPQDAFSVGLLDPEDPDVQTMLVPKSNDTHTGWQGGDFWRTHKAVPLGAGFELYEQVPVWNWDVIQQGAEQWTYSGYIPLQDNSDTIPPDALALILDHYQGLYDHRAVYLAKDQPDVPREDDLRLGPINYLESTPIRDTGLTCAAYQVGLSSYTTRRISADAPAKTDWYSNGQEYIILTRDGDSGSFQEALESGSSPYRLGSLEKTALTAYYMGNPTGMANVELTFWREGYDKPLGPGGFWQDLFGPEDGTPAIERKEFYDSAIQEHYTLDGFSAVRGTLPDTDEWYVLGVDVTRPDLTTYRGIRVGDSRAKVMDAYPTLIKGDYNGYFPDADLLYFIDGLDPRYPYAPSQEYENAILFFFEEDRVSEIRMRILAG